MAMTTGNSGNKHPTPEVNVTPLVDIALVVLIIFMCVTPMMTKTFWLNLPAKDDKQESKPAAEPSKPLVMRVGKNGALRINQTELSKDELAQRLPRMLAAASQKVLYFDAEDGVLYGTAVEAMDLARAAGARSIAIVTKKLAQ
jgi:biopolymer transport protein ExbD